MLQSRGYVYVTPSSVPRQVIVHSGEKNAGQQYSDNRHPVLPAHTAL